MIVLADVQISFGDGVTLSLPTDDALLEKRFVEYLGTDKDALIREFRSNLKGSIRDAKRIGKDGEVTSAISDVLVGVLESDENSSKIYSTNGEAYAEFLGRNKETQDRRKELAKTSSLKEVFTNSDLYLDMIGASGLKSGREYDSEDRIPRPRVEEYLKEIKANIKSVQVPPIYLKVMVKGLKKKYLQQIEDLKSNDKRSFLEDRGEEFEQLKSTFLANPTFMSSILFNFSLEIPSEKKITVQVPEQSPSVSKLANHIIDSYVDDIRNIHNIRSGGFVPKGRHYTRETGRKTKEIEYNFSPLAQTRLTIDLSDIVDYEVLHDEFTDYFDRADLRNPAHIEDMELYYEDISNDIYSSLTKSSFIDRAIDSLDVPNELKFWEFIINVSINKPKAKDLSKAESLQEKNNILSDALKQSRMDVNHRILSLGKFDFSYYSKGGEVISDKMNEHLEEIRVKLNWLKARGIDGGI